VKRLHLFEFNDQAWLPSSLRDALTDYLQFAIKVGRPYAPIVPILKDALTRTDSQRVIDLCSGGGGAWAVMLPEMPASLQVQLTDKFPNVPAFRLLQSAAPAQVQFHSESVDASAVPPEMTGFRTLFSSFHHFPPDQARAILQDAVEKRQGIGIFEATQRSAPAILMMLLTPLVVLLSTPFIRPLRLSRLFWTYLPPVMPLLVPFDGIVSCLRTYSPEELRALVQELPPDAQNYHWDIGEAKAARGGLPVTYLLGYPNEIRG
jgi:hypothetical protein